MKRIHSDKDKKFSVMRNKLERMGFMLMALSSYSPGSNGFAERMNRTLLDKVIALIKEGN